MNRLATDLLILVLIATPVTALALLVPQENLRIERNWGTVIYSPPVTRSQAEDFADVMAKNGIFAGNPMTFKLQRNGDEWILMMASASNYEETISRNFMVMMGKELCRLAFAGKTVSFVLVDKDLQPVDELVPPTAIPAD